MKVQKMLRKSQLWASRQPVERYKSRELSQLADHRIYIKHNSRTKARRSLSSLAKEIACSMNNSEEGAKEECQWRVDRIRRRQTLFQA